jgi:DNA modification methylase
MNAPETFEWHDQKIVFASSEQMTEIQDNSIDVIVTSPPYNRNKQYSSDSEEMHNDNMPESEYLAFLTRVWRECHRVTADSGVFFLNIGDSANDQGLSEKVAGTAVAAGWTRIQDIIWVKSIHGKGHYTPSGGNRRFNNVWEHIYLFAKHSKKYRLDPKAIGIPYADKSNIGRYGESDVRDPGNVWHIPYEKTTGLNIKKGHDAPFPIGLPYQCIKAVPGVQIVLDPFVGTGTTLAAGACLGLRGIGYEKYPRKEIIKQTLEEGLKFVPEPPILIPHLEETIHTLWKLLLESSPRWRPPKSKKEGERWEIALDILKKLGISSPDIKVWQSWLKYSNEEPQERKDELLKES